MCACACVSMCSVILCLQARVQLSGAAYMSTSRYTSFFMLLTACPSMRGPMMSCNVVNMLSTTLTIHSINEYTDKLPYFP